MLGSFLKGLAIENIENTRCMDPISTSMYGIFSYIWVGV